MTLNIQISGSASQTELSAVIAALQVLQNCNDRSVQERNDYITAAPVTATPPSDVAVQQVAPGESGPVLSGGSGSDLPPSISATVPAVPAAYSNGTPHPDDTATVSIPLPPASVSEGPTPPVPPVPVAVVPPPPASNGAGVALDKEGLPWDGRIHSSNKQMIATGTWRRRKNTPDETWEAVRAELRQSMAAPTPLEAHIAADAPVDAATAFAVPPPPVVTTAPPVAVSGTVGAPPLSPVPPIPAPPPVATASGAPVATDAINALLVRITDAQTAGAISLDQVQAACASAGLPNIRGLMQRPDLVATIDAALFGQVA